MKARVGVLAVLLLAGVTACDDDDDDDAAVVSAVVPGTLTDGAANVTAPPVTPTEVTVVATDYRFNGLPQTMPVGTKLALRNDSPNEVHEMVVIRIPDDVKQPIGELLAMPEAELDALVGDIEPTTVLVALPGEAGRAVEGEGVIDEAGRYAVLCFIPVGADPAVVAEAMDAEPDSTGQPNLGDGPPHITQGMYTEMLVQSGG